MGSFDIKALDGMDLRTSFSEKKEKAIHDKHDFLKLFMAQLQHQDPLNPQEGADFLAQLAQFSTVEGIEKMSSSLHSMEKSLLGTNALQSTHLVGKKVEMRTDTAEISLGDNHFRGGIHLNRSVPDLTMVITNEQGQHVDTIKLGPHSSGDVAFSWKGDPGLYKMRAFATIDGQSQAMETSAFATVQSVQFSSIGEEVMLNTRGGRLVPLSEAKTIGE